jgi:arylsulfatase A-like enzyme
MWHDVGVVILAVLGTFSKKCNAQMAPLVSDEFEITGRDGFVEQGTISSITKPNLLFIMADQQRWDAFSAAQNELKCYEGYMKIRTPNLDRLAASGVRFQNAYSAATSCGPARASLRTGCTLQRTGVLTNKLVSKSCYSLMNIFKNRIENLTSLDQLLVEFKSYVSEYYGKWHLSDPFYYRPMGPSSLSPQRMYRNLTADYWPPGMSADGVIIQYDDFDSKTATPIFDKKNWKVGYERELGYLLNQRGVTTASYSYQADQQLNPLTGLPYDPIRLDSYFGDATVLKKRKKNDDIYGKNVLSSQYSTTSVLGGMGLKALTRLTQADKPFILTVSFNSPHPVSLKQSTLACSFVPYLTLLSFSVQPMIASPEYFDYYYQRRSQLFVPLSHKDERTNSAYFIDSKQLDKSSVEILQELAAVYYALVEEVDTWVGHLIDQLNLSGLANQTMVVFTADHGEMLGAHELRGKGNLYEEATHVPLIMSFPGEIPSVKVVSEPVSHLDVFATGKY